MFEFKSDLLTLEPCNIVGWDILVSIDVWANVAIFTHFNCMDLVFFAKHWDRLSCDWDMLYFG